MSDLESDIKLPFFVINLKNRPDRWNSTLNQLDKIEPLIDKIIKINATNAESAKRQKYNYLSKMAYHNLQDTKSTSIIPTYGALGCAISHIFCWKYMIKNKINCAIICEDDLHIKDESLCYDILESYYSIRELESKHMFNNIISFDANTEKAQYKLYNKMYNLYQINTGHITKLHFYMLNLNCAEYLLSNILPITFQIDVQICKKFIGACKYNLFLFNKETGLTEQKKFTSNVQYFIPTLKFIKKIFENIFDSDGCIAEKIFSYLNYNFNDYNVNNNIDGNNLYFNGFFSYQ